MRIAKVIGKLTLNRCLKDLVPGSFLIVRTCNRHTLSGAAGPNEETVVLYDQLSAREGSVVGLVEGREATAPFWPKKVPYDAYNACILDSVDFEPIVTDKPTGTL